MAPGEVRCEMHALYGDGRCLASLFCVWTGADYAAVKIAYDEHYARWASVYPRVLALSEEGLLRPMWWPAGA